MPGMGDMLWFLPHVRAIADHFSHSKHVDLLARPSTQASSLLAHEKCVGTVLPLYRCQLNWQGEERFSNHQEPYAHDGLFGLFRLAQALKAKAYDSVWILDRHAYYVYAAFLAGIPLRYGLGYGLERMLLTGPILAQSHKKGYARDRATHWLRDMGVEIKAYENPLTLSPSSGGVPKKDPWACIGIGASEVERKWIQFPGLVAALAEEGVRCFICGGPGEAEEAKRLRSQIPEPLRERVVCVTDKRVLETADLVSRADFYVGNDTFLYNLAALQGKPALAIAGTVPAPLYLRSMASIQNPLGIQYIMPQSVVEKLRRLELI